MEGGGREEEGREEGRREGGEEGRGGRGMGQTTDNATYGWCS